jgi:hypothetical protein
VQARSAASDFAKLVVKAPTSKTIEERAALYAELLLVCGGCHRAINEAGSKRAAIRFRRESLAVGLWCETAAGRARVAAVSAGQVIRARRPATKQHSM